MAAKTLTIDGKQISAAEGATLLQAAEEALQKSEERFRQVAENVGDFIWEVDAKGLYRYTSPTVKKILGYTPDELIGKMHFYDLFAPEVREQLKRAAFEAFESRQSFQAFPNTNISKNGQFVQLETSGVPVVELKPDSLTAKAFVEIAKNVSSHLPPKEVQEAPVQESKPCPGSSHAHHHHGHGDDEHGGHSHHHRND